MDRERERERERERGRERERERESPGGLLPPCSQKEEKKERASERDTGVPASDAQI